LKKIFSSLRITSVFGKTMKNIHNRVDIKLISNESEATKLMAQPNYKGFTTFSENLVAIHMNVTKLSLTNQYI